MENFNIGNSDECIIITRDKYQDMKDRITSLEDNFRNVNNDMTVYKTIRNRGYFDPIYTEVLTNDEAVIRATEEADNLKDKLEESNRTVRSLESLQNNKIRSIRHISLFDRLFRYRETIEKITSDE